MRIFLTIFALVCVANSQHPHDCVAPPEWEAYVVATDHRTNFYSRGRMFYDGKSQKVRIQQDVEINSTEAHYDSLYLYKQMVHYRVDQKTRKCDKMALNHTFVPVEVHPNSTSLGEVIIGSLSGRDTGVIVHNWMHKTTDGVFYQLFTSHGCLPVELSYFGKNSMGTEIHFHYQYYDIKLGVPSAEIFDVPKECITYG